MVIGWGTCVKIAAIRTNPPRGANGVQKNMPISTTKYVDIVASFQTSYYISGIAPYGDALVILAYIPEEQNGEKDFSSTIPSRQVSYSKLERMISRPRVQANQRCYYNFLNIFKLDTALFFTDCGFMMLY